MKRFLNDIDYVLTRHKIKVYENEYSMKVYKHTNGYLYMTLGELGRIMNMPKPGPYWTYGPYDHIDELLRVDLVLDKISNKRGPMPEERIFLKYFENWDMKRYKQNIVTGSLGYGY